MPIALDGTAAYSAVSTASGTFSYTNNGNALFVGVLGDTTDNIGSVKYGGVALTKIISLQTPANTGFIYLWYLTAPPTGVNNIIIDASNATLIQPLVTSYTGVLQTSSIDGSVSGTVNGTTISGTVTTTNDNCWAVGIARDGVATSWTAGANTTIRADNGGTSLAIFDTNSPKTPAGADIMTVNLGATANIGVVMATFIPSKGAGLTTHSKFWGA